MTRSFILMVVFFVTATGLSFARDTQPDPELRKLLTAAIEDTDSFVDRFDAEVWLTDMSTRLSRQVPDAQVRYRGGVRKRLVYFKDPEGNLLEFCEYR